MHPELTLKLANDEVSVWCASLDLPPQRLESCLSTLSPNEISRAERFHFERDRNYYIAGRGLLRSLLAAYLDTDPAQLQFCYQTHGKPYLREIHDNRILQFNLSHSNGMVVYAFCWNRRIGIDLEYIRPMDNQVRFAEQLFSDAESRYLQSLPVDQRSRAFFKLWTCKEAFLKACGAGLTVSIDQVEITLLDGGKARLAGIVGSQEQADGWQLETFTPAPGFQACLAVEGIGGRTVISHLRLIA